MFAQPRKAYILLGLEPELDCHDPQQAMAALKDAALVVMLTPFSDGAARDYADVLLPITPFTETSGSFVNTEGRIQSFTGVVRPLGDARPGWKVLRVLGNLLALPGLSTRTRASRCETKWFPQEAHSLPAWTIRRQRRFPVTDGDDWRVATHCRCADLFCRPDCSSRSVTPEDA
jgi:NADH dehydrogenase/NADH:ubiquinone oxidoreductase subunit G